MALSRNQKYGLGAAVALTGAYLLARKDDSVSREPLTFEKGGKTYFGSSPSMIGLNAQPGTSGFHPSGATFSTWAQVAGDQAARVIKIAPTRSEFAEASSVPQEWIRVPAQGRPYSGIPYSGDYDPSLPILRLSDKTETQVLSAVLSAIYAMRSAMTGTSPPAEPLVLTSGAPAPGVPPEIAIAEFEFEGEDPRP